MKQKKSVGAVFLILILGALVGTVFGEVIGLILPEGVVKQFFLKSIEPGFENFELKMLVIYIKLTLTISADRRIRSRRRNSGKRTLPHK